MSYRPRSRTFQKMYSSRAAPGAGRRGVYKRSRTYRTGTSIGYGRAIGPARMARIRPRGSEMKSVDVLGPAQETTLTTWVPSTSGTLGMLNMIVPGTQSWQRIGRRIECSSVRIRGTFERKSTWAPTGAGVYKKFQARILLIWDAVNNGETPTVPLILRDNINTASVAAYNTNYMSGQNRDYSGRFTILMDFVKDLPGLSVGATGQTTGVASDIWSFDESRSLKGMASTYTGAPDPLAVTNQCQTGGLFLLCIGNWEYTGVTDSPYDLFIHSRLYFKDA